MHSAATYWTDTSYHLPGSSTDWVAQAVRSEEVNSAATVAEAWDSIDLETNPGIDNSNFINSWQYEQLGPGWHCGPYTNNGIAVLNANRHQGSPNILYADGHVRADADLTTLATDSRLPAAPVGSWAGAKITTWSDFDPTWGNINHIVPQRSHR